MRSQMGEDYRRKGATNFIHFLILPTSFLLLGLLKVSERAIGSLG